MDVDQDGILANGVIGIINIQDLPRSAVLHIREADFIDARIGIAQVRPLPVRPREKHLQHSLAHLETAALEQGEKDQDR